MCSKNPQLDLHDPKTLEALEQAFDATQVSQQAPGSFFDLESDSDFRNALSLKLTALAEDGVTDPVELLERALESLPLR
ncbi:MAG: hypothetical protein R3D30_13905 [Hyphomicrobiales bacterium]